MIRRDKHGLVKNKTEAGVPQEEATAHAEICAEIYGNLVTKADLAATLEVLEGRPGQNMTGLADMKTNLIRWMIGTPIVALSVWFTVLWVALGHLLV